MRPSPSCTPSRLLRRVSVATAASATAAALLAPGVASASPPAVLAVPTAHAAVAFGARVIFPKGNPVANKKWHVTLQAWKGARKLHAKDRYEFLLGSSVVAHRPGVSFFGTGHDTLTFPGAAVGHELTLRVLITTKYGTRGFNHTVSTRK